MLMNLKVQGLLMPLQDQLQVADISDHGCTQRNNTYSLLTSGWRWA